jgi:hypothetical protein
MTRKEVCDSSRSSSRSSISMLTLAVVMVTCFVIDHDVATTFIPDAVQPWVPHDFLALGPANMLYHGTVIHGSASRGFKARLRRIGDRFKSNDPNSELTIRKLGEMLSWRHLTPTVCILRFRVHKVTKPQIVMTSIAFRHLLAYFLRHTDEYAAFERTMVSSSATSHQTDLIFISVDLLTILLSPLWRHLAPARMPRFAAVQIRIPSF